MSPFRNTPLAWIPVLTNTTRTSTPALADAVDADTPRPRQGGEYEYPRVTEGNPGLTRTIKTSPKGANFPAAARQQGYFASSACTASGVSHAMSASYRERLRSTSITFASSVRYVFSAPRGMANSTMMCTGLPSSAL